jgi:hypothetical protein
LKINAKLSGITKSVDSRSRWIKMKKRSLVEGQKAGKKLFRSRAQTGRKNQIIQTVADKRILSKLL